MKLTIKEVAQARGFENAKQLADAMTKHFGGLVSYNTIYPLWNDTAQRFDRATLDRLCTFFNVPIGMLIQFINADDSASGGAPADLHKAERTKSTSKKATRKQAAAVVPG